MPKSVKVVLGGTEFEVMELPARANVAWRKRLQEAVSGLVEQGLNLSSTDVETQNTSQVLESVMGLVAEAPGLAGELMREYSPVIDGAWPELEDAIYESELIEGFMQVCKLAFPFGKLVDLYKSLSASSGAIARRTQPSLH